MSLSDTDCLICDAGHYGELLVLFDGSLARLCAKHYNLIRWLAAHDALCQEVSARRLLLESDINRGAETTNGLLQRVIATRPREDQVARRIWGWIKAAANGEDVVSDTGEALPEWLRGEECHD